MLSQGRAGFRPGYNWSSAVYCRVSGGVWSGYGPGFAGNSLVRRAMGRGEGLAWAGELPSAALARFSQSSHCKGVGEFSAARGRRAGQIS